MIFILASKLQGIVFIIFMMLICTIGSFAVREYYPELAKEYGIEDDNPLSPEEMHIDG